MLSKPRAVLWTCERPPIAYCCSTLHGMIKRFTTPKSTPTRKAGDVSRRTRACARRRSPTLCARNVRKRPNAVSARPGTQTFGVLAASWKPVIGLTLKGEIQKSVPRAIVHTRRLRSAVDSADSYVCGPRKQIVLRNLASGKKASGG